MSNVPVFTSFQKSTNDFFNKAFPSSHKVDVTTKAVNGLTFVSTAEWKAKKDGSPYVLGKLEAKYKLEAKGLEFTGTLDTDSLVKADVSVSNTLPGLKVVFKPQLGKSQEVTGGLEFQNHNVGVLSTLLWKAEGDALVTSSVVTGRQGLLFGFESNYYVKRGEPEKVPSGLDSFRGLFNYKASNLDLTLTVKKQWNADGGESLKSSAQKLLVGGTFEHKASEDTTLHSSFEYDTTKPVTEALKLQFGGVRKLDEETTTQAKFNADGKLTVQVAKQLSSQLKGNLTTELNTFNLAASDHKFALGLSFKA